MKTTTMNMETLINTGCYMVMENQVVKSCEISAQTISGARLDQTTFLNCTFSDCTFYATTFVDCIFIGCHFENCSFLFGHIKNCTFKSSRFKNCNLNLGGIYGSHFTVCEFSSNSNDFMDFDRNSLINCFMDEKTSTKLIYKINYYAAA